MLGAREGIGLLTLAAGLNCVLLGVENHALWLDIACAGGLARAAVELSRVGAHRIVRVAIVAIGMRWVTSLVALSQQSPMPIGTRLVVGAQLCGAGWLAVSRFGFGFGFG